MANTPETSFFLVIFTFSAKSEDRQAVSAFSSLGCHMAVFTFLKCGLKTSLIAPLIPQEPCRDNVLTVTGELLLELLLKLA